MADNLRSRLIALRDEVGYSKFWAEVKSLSRERLDNPGREKRQKFSWGKHKSLYQKCGGHCWWCGQPMILLKGKVEVDHFDPNEQQFNGESNLGLLHWECNREKGSMSLVDQAKFLGITVTDLIRRFNG